VERIGLIAAALLLMGAAPDVTGFWRTPDGAGVVEIAQCGTDVCGWLMGFRDQPPPMDYRGKTECGLEIIFPMAPSDDGKWTGEITDPKTGDLYQAWMTAAAGDTLYLRGYLALPIFGQTQIWTRFHGNVTRDCRID